MVSERLSRLLTAYVDDELSPRQRRSVERIIQRSSEAGNFLQNLQADSAEIRDLPPVAAPRDLSDEILKKLTRPVVAPSLAPPAPQRALPAWFRHALAASVLLGASLGTFIYFVTRMAPGPVAERTEEEPFLPPLRDTGTEALVAEVVPVGNDAKALVGPVLPPKTAAPSFANRAKPTPPSTIVTAPADAKGPLLGAPLSPSGDFSRPDVKLALLLPVQEIKKREKELLMELGRGDAHRIDLDCPSTAAALDRLHSSLESEGIRLVDNDAKARLKLPFKADVAVFLESVTPKEMVSVLCRLCPGGSKNVAPISKGSLSVNDLTLDDCRKLDSLLGIDTARLRGTPRPLGVDIRKPLSTMTQEQIVQALKQPARLQPSKSNAKPAGRTAMAVTCDFSRKRPLAPDEIPQFENNHDRSSGSLQILLVLHPR
jgi:hypothetical protein